MTLYIEIWRPFSRGSFISFKVGHHWKRFPVCICLANIYAKGAIYKSLVHPKIQEATFHPSNCCHCSECSNISAHLAMELAGLRHLSDLQSEHMKEEVIGWKPGGQLDTVGRILWLWRGLTLRTVDTAWWWGGGIQWKKVFFCQVKERDLNSDAKYFLNPTNNWSDLF